MNNIIPAGKPKEPACRQSAAGIRFGTVLLVQFVHRTPVAGTCPIQPASGHQQYNQEDASQKLTVHDPSPVSIV
ncbi:MAG: hypothetical protein H6851_02000 [Geminicoccaceae bacterium]|nr:hypothetical protein [Geminicoccaceae bacterium]